MCRSGRGRGYRSPSDAGHPQRGHTQAGNRGLPNSFDGIHGKSVRVRWGEVGVEVGVWG